MMELKVFSDKAKKIFNNTLELENIATGYNFTEGPVWDIKKDLLYFTDFRNFNIFTWQQGKGAQLFRKDSGRAIGLSMAADGRIVSAESKSHAVAFAAADKSEIIAGSYEGRRLNSPNDVVVKSDGSVFLTDPYSDAIGDARELEFNGVFCVPVKDGRLSAEDIILIDRMERPNGIAFSPDEEILYVNDTNKQHIVAYQMHEDNTASYIGVFATLDTSYGPGNADGMKVDTEGNVYLTGPGGIWVLDNSGTPIAIMKVPEFAGNLCFGGRDSSTLFITASSSVYKVPVGIPGIVPKRN